MHLCAWTFSVLVSTRVCTCSLHEGVLIGISFQPFFHPGNIIILIVYFSLVPAYLLNRGVYLYMRSVSCLFSVVYCCLSMQRGSLQ